MTVLPRTLRGALSLIAASAIAAPVAHAQSSRGLKVFISVDMEGLAGVVAAADVNPSAPDYPLFRTIMAGETNAAVEGAFRAGATDVLVRDSHGDKRNLRPADVDPRARLLRGASADAVVFVGYHAKAGTPNAILEHTSTGNVVDMAINGVSLPEAGYNALTAGLYGVPVVFVAGDQAVVDQVRALLGSIGAVAVKTEIGGDASLGLSPPRAQDRSRPRPRAPLSPARPVHDDAQGPPGAPTAPGRAEGARRRVHVHEPRSARGTGGVQRDEVSDVSLCAD